jgi:RNA polymerase sigma-70 factor (ECF subfamily)
VTKELEILKKYKVSGNLELLGQLYAPHMHLVFGVCLKYFKEKARSEDAVMQIFEKLVTDLRKHEILNFKSWLYVTARNYCLMELRKNGGKENISIENMEFAIAVHPNDDDTLDEQYLEECISTLKDEQKKCVELFYLKEKCYLDIAEMTAFELKKVKSYIQNGKRNLKTCIESKRGTE